MANGATGERLFLAREFIFLIFDLRQLGSAAQLIAEAIVRYTTPVNNPKILLVKDHNSGDESSEDTLYVRDSLLRRYDVTFFEEPSGGLSEADTEGYDLIWLNNPGNPMGSEVTKQRLLSLAGGVVLQGDDLSRGEGFNVEDLTGLEHVDNGTEVRCAGRDYNHNNNNGEQYRLVLDPAKIPGVDDSTLRFEYGNDIDNTRVLRDDLEVLAYAVGGPKECIEERPAIVRYFK